MDSSHEHLDANGLPIRHHTDHSFRRLRQQLHPNGSLLTPREPLTEGTRTWHAGDFGSPDNTRNLLNEERARSNSLSSSPGSYRTPQNDFESPVRRRSRFSITPSPLQIPQPSPSMSNALAENSTDDIMNDLLGTTAPRSQDEEIDDDMVTGEDRESTEDIARDILGTLGFSPPIASRPVLTTQTNLFHPCIYSQCLPQR